MEYLLPILIIVVLILLNGVFVAAEFAIIGAPRATIERRAADGNAMAKIVSEILRDPRRQDRYIATAQLGITFASLGLGMYGEHVLAHWIEGWLDGFGPMRWIAAHALASVLSIAILTYFHIVVGEMIPKSMALMHAERTVLGITPLMLFTKAILYPLVVGLNGLGNGILSIFGIRREFSAASYHTSEELQYIVEESQEGGLLRAEEGQVLRDLFAFGERTAREVMVPRVRIDGVPLGATPEELRDLLRKDRRTRYPVYTGDFDHIQGVIHIKDILRLLRDHQPLTSTDVRETLYVPETVELDNLLESMRRARTQMVVVMDEHGGTEGIITIEDLCVEVVGEVEEGNEEMVEIRPTGDGRFIVAGGARLDDVGEAMGRVLEHPQIDTVSGLVLALLERPPVVGDSVVYENSSFEVSAVEGHGVLQCLVTPPPADDAPAPTSM